MRQPAIRSRSNPAADLLFGTTISPYSSLPKFAPNQGNTLIFPSHLIQANHIDVSQQSTQPIDAAARQWQS